ncbi:MAG: hypothetical protein AAFP22_04425 [Planctomycetota bacterium]
MAQTKPTMDTDAVKAAAAAFARSEGGQAPEGFTPPAPPPNAAQPPADRKEGADGSPPPAQPGSGAFHSPRFTPEPAPAAPPAGAGDAPPTQDGDAPPIDDDTADLAETLANPKRPRRTDEEFATLLEQRGYHPDAIPTIVRQVSRKTLDKMVETPLPSGSLEGRPSGGTEASADGGSSDSSTQAGDLDAAWAGVEKKLTDGLLVEEDQAKDFVSELRGIFDRGVKQASAGAPKDVAALRARIDALEGAAGSEHAQAIERHGAALTEARARATARRPALADKAFFRERFKPVLEAEVAKDPSLRDDPDLLFELAEARVFRGQAAESADDPPTPRPKTPKAAPSNDPSSRAPRLTEAGVASSALARVLAGESPDAVVGEQKRMASR